MLPQLILYGTLRCHLCEQAEAMVVPIAQQHRLQLSLIDVAEQGGLDAYETRIPVLKYGQLELDWPFDSDAISAFIQGAKN